MFRLFSYFSFALFLLITSLSCDSSETPPTVPPPTSDLRKITLSVDDVSCTEVWLSIKADSITFPSEIILLKDSVAQTISLCCSDTVLYIDSLLPNKSYNYKAILTADTTIKSEPVTAQTLDTTSHNFTWQTFTFGEAGAGSSVLYDVAIIDENNIWAVGEIYMLDSLGNPDPNFYNAAHWNGTVWELKRILYDENIWSIKTIYAFAENDVWFSAFVHFYNGEFIELQIPDILMGWSVNKIWGTSSEDLYVVGNGGNIAHWDGSEWTKIESGTESNVNDIWGNVLDTTGEIKILCAVSNIDGSGENKILEIKNKNVVELYWPSDSCSTGCIVYSLWFRNNSKLYASGDGIWVRQKDGKWNKQHGLPPYFVGSIRGNDVNDILCVGAFGFAAHFNGLGWKQITDIPYAVVLGEVSVKDENIVVVGFNGSQAVLIKGTRN